ncbi:MAG TPA: hypothetical protein PKM24_11255 [Saprospiraceae bacterium]|jgi:hypothetical protein|nr:hypothetical protein [Saprospiraceae bacterium]
MKKVTTILMTVLMTATIAYGQTQKATTENGKKVILNSDGTWKYADTVKSVQKSLDPNDCSNWISTETDKMDGSTSTASKNTIIVSTDGGKKGFGIFMMQGSKGGVILSIQAVGAGSCIDEGAKINILFTDGSRLVLSNNGKFNCKGNSTVYFGGVFGKKSELEELKTKKIQTMRVWTSDSYVEKDFTTDNQEEFFNVINCLTK